jgi:hypothetical protein
MVVDPDPYPHSECEMRIHKKSKKIGSNADSDPKSTVVDPDSYPDPGWIRIQ